MVRSAKRVLAAVLAIAMIAAFMPAMQDDAFAAKKAKKPAKVKGVKVSVAKNNNVTVTWKKAKNAKKYTVSIKDGSTKLTATKTSKKTKLTFKGGNAVKYTVKVRGINGKKKGAFSKAASKKTNDLVKAAATELEEAKAELDQAKSDLEQANTDKEAAEKAAKEAQEAVEAAKKELADAKAAAAVEKAIAKIPAAADLKYADVANIDAASNAFDGLTDYQKALVGTTDKEALEAAKNAKTELVAIHEVVEAAKKAEVNPGGGENFSDKVFGYDAAVIRVDGLDFYVIDRVEGKKALLIAKDAYGDAMSFYDEDKDAPNQSFRGCDNDLSGVWEYSQIRELLNGEFLESHPIINKMAVETNIEEKYYVMDESEDNIMQYSKKTKDKVFLPSVDDAGALASGGYAPTTEDTVRARFAKGSKAGKLQVDGEDVPWWTRSTTYGQTVSTANMYSSYAYVMDYSTSYVNIREAQWEQAYVRPTFWLSLED
jgi:exonuclease VII small subunit